MAIAGEFEEKRFTYRGVGSLSAVSCSVPTTDVKLLLVNNGGANGGGGYQSPFLPLINGCKVTADLTVTPIVLNSIWLIVIRPGAYAPRCLASLLGTGEGIL